MSSVADALTIHQLLGRIAYFHVLFIEPALLPAATRSAGVGELCCNHGTAPGRRTVAELLSNTAWNVLAEIGDTLGPRARSCPERSESCCATCHVATAAAAIAMTWSEVELRTYYGTASSNIPLACGLMAAERLGRAFAAHHSLSYATLSARSMPAAMTLPTELPLTDELLALWAYPTASAHQPVTTWLNHCAHLDDIRRVLETRRTRT